VSIGWSPAQSAAHVSGELTVAGAAYFCLVGMGAEGADLERSRVRVSSTFLGGDCGLYDEADSWISSYLAVSMRSISGQAGQ
jgi:hypothetical protein